MWKTKLPEPEKGIKKHPHDGMGVFLCSLYNLSHFVYGDSKAGYFSGSIVLVIYSLGSSSLDYLCRID